MGPVPSYEIQEEMDGMQYSSVATLQVIQVTGHTGHLEKMRALWEIYIYTVQIRWRLLTPMKIPAQCQWVHDNGSRDGGAGAPSSGHHPQNDLVTRRGSLGTAAASSRPPSAP